MKNLLRFNCLLAVLWSNVVISAPNENSSYLYDPTKPNATYNKSKDNVAQGRQQQDTGLKLQSLILKNKQYKAIISGKIYQVGEQVSGYKIEKITAKKVHLARGTEQRILELYSYEIKY